MAEVTNLAEVRRKRQEDRKFEEYIRWVITGKDDKFVFKDTSPFVTSTGGTIPTKPKPRSPS